jgi:hypothetical protein
MSGILKPIPHNTQVGVMAGLACNSRKGEPIATGCCNPDPLIQFTALTRKLALFNLREAEQHALHCVSPSASSEK